MIEFVVARNEQELCEIFEDLLFMRAEKFAPGDMTPEESKFRFSNQALEQIERRGILNRIFRRWFQTTWGWRNWSPAFEGETPRQELSRNYGEFNQGNVIFSVAFKKEGAARRLYPHIFRGEDLEEKSIFLSGVRALNNKGGIARPHFDPHFPNLVQLLKASEHIAKKLKSYSPPSFEEEKYLSLFWVQAGPNLVFNSFLDLPKEETVALAMIAQDCLNEFVAEQNKKAGSYIQVDDLVSALWLIFRRADRKLAPLEEVIGGKEEKFRKNIMSSKLRYSTRAFYHLGLSLDEFILLPLERYFGGAEIVWTDKMNFMNDLAVTIQLANNNFRPPPIRGITRQEKRALDFLGLEEVAGDVERLWCSPPTAFRILPSVQLPA